MVFNPIQLGALNGAIANLSAFSLGPNAFQNLAGFGYLLGDVYKTEAFRPDLLLGVAKTVTALAHQGEARNVEDIQRGLVADLQESLSLGAVRFGETAQILNKARQKIQQKQGAAVSLEISMEQMRSKGVEWEEVAQQMQSVITLAEKSGRKDEVAAFLSVLCEKIDIPLGTDQIEAEWARLVKAKVLIWAHQSDFERRAGGRSRGLLSSQVTELLEKLASYIPAEKKLGRLSTAAAAMIRLAATRETNRTTLEMLLDEVRLKAEEGTDRNWLELQEVLEMYEGDSTIYTEKLVALRNQMRAVEAGTFRSRRVEDFSPDNIAKIFSKAAGKEMSWGLIEERLVATLKFATARRDISQPVVARLREVEEGRCIGTVEFLDERGQKRQLNFFVTFEIVKELGSTRTIPAFHFKVPTGKARTVDFKAGRNETGFYLSPS